MNHQGLVHKCKEDSCGRAFASRRRLAVHVDEAHKKNNGDKQVRKKKRSSKKKRAKRRDRGLHKRAMAVLLTGADVTPQEERALVEDAATAPLQVEVVQEELSKNAELKESFAREQEEADDDDTGANLCLRELSTGKAVTWCERQASVLCQDEEFMMSDTNEEEEDDGALADDSDSSNDHSNLP